MQTETWAGMSNLKPVTDQDRIKYPPTYPQGFNPRVFNPKTGFGLLYRHPFEQGNRENFFYNGIEVEFMDFWPTDQKGRVANVIRAFYTRKTCAGEYTLVTLWIPIKKIDLETLKKLEVWNVLSNDLKATLETAQVVEAQEDVNAIHDRMEKARAGRKPRAEYADLPREITCCNRGCNRKDYIPPATLEKKAGIAYLKGDERTITLKEFLDTYECSECKPRKRGRERNPLFKDIPREVSCSKCGKDCAVNAGQVYEKTEGKLDKIKEFCNTYLCRKCNPEWGSWLKGKRGRKSKKKELV